MGQISFKKINIGPSIDVILRDDPPRVRDGSSSE